MGYFTTGITVVLADGADGPAGMTVNSFTSVSLDPILVLVSLSVGSRTLQAVRAKGIFTISVLECSQEDVAHSFGRPKDAFPSDHVLRDAGGHPYVRGSLAHLRCETYSTIRLGDHDVVVGEVKDLGVAAGQPLLFHRGSFARLDTASVPYSLDALRR
jgi:flavin reductase (DIM6/NTAB) family NADH-FMN oxidoreductase RutF